MRREATACWIAVLYTSIAGNLFVALSPMFWGGFMQYLQYSDERIGEIMSGEFFGATAATVAGILYMHRRGLNLRYVMYAALSVYAVGNLLTPQMFGHPQGLRWIRVLCGLSSGTSYLAAATAITGLGSPPRLVAMFYGAPFITGALLQPLMHSVFEHWGFGRTFLLIAAASAASVALYTFFPRRADNREVAEQGGSIARAPILVGILAVALLLQYIGNSGIWLFFERIGDISGHPPQTVANIVGIGTGMALSGTWLSAMLANKLKPVVGILWGTAIITVSSLALYFSSHLAVYAGSVAAFNAMITFLTPFYFILLVQIYSPAKAVIIGNICLALGFAAGPLLIGYTVHGDQFSESVTATVVLFLISAALVVLFQFLHQEAKL